MPAKAAAGIIAQQQHNEHPQRMLLESSTGIGRTPVSVESTLIADTYRMRIETAGMRTGTLYGAKRLYIAVLTDIKMITCTGESPAQVVCTQIMFRIVAVATRSGTVNDNKIDKSHNKNLISKFNTSDFRFPASVRNFKNSGLQDFRTLKLPNPKAPDFKTPKLPNLKAPNFKILKLPNPKAPDFKAPKLPNLKAPDFKTPKLPNLRTPDFKTPKLPNLRTPNLKASKALPVRPKRLTQPKPLR